MDANEARALTKASVGPSVAPALEVAYQRIRDAAERGQRSVSHPFYGAPWDVMFHCKENAFQTLRDMGFEVKHHVNPDPGDPRSYAYDTVSW